MANHILLLYHCINIALDIHNYSINLAILKFKIKDKLILKLVAFKKCNMQAPINSCTIRY